MKRKILIFLLCLALLPAIPAAAAWDGPIDAASALLAEGAVLTQNTYWTGSDYRTENYIELSPDAALRPMVVSGDVLCSAQSLQTMASSLEARGLHAVSGINGGFYTMSNQVPVGAVVRDGVLRSDCDGLSAVGFRADGGALIGTPQFRLTLTAGETRLSVPTLNHLRRTDAPALYTADFAATTKAAGSGWNVVCVPDGDVPLSGSLTLTVEAVTADGGAVAIPEGRVVLSLAGDTEGEMPVWLAALSAGDELTLEVACAGGWEDVESAVCLLYPLLENGAVCGGLEKYKGNDPRSAVGVKADGSLVLYTVDGRQSGYSVGAGLDAVAERLRELGCVAAGALDGGASTQLGAVLPGDAALSRVNRPSASRNVVNYIFLVTDAQPAGKAARLALYPLDVDAMAGAAVELTVKAVDANGYAATVPEAVAYTVSDGLGAVENGVFHAAAGKAGSGTITASAPGLEPVSIPVTVVESPDELSIYGEVYGHLTTKLTLAPGQEVDLTVRARQNHLLLTSTDECFTWTLEPDGGTVDGTGHIIPAPVSGSGLLTVSAGEAETQIPITVWSGVPFRDVLTTDDCFAAVKYVYDHELFNGTGDTTFDPAVVMNRGMLVTVLWRMNGEPEAETQPGFGDVNPEEWYGPAVAWAAGTGLVNGYSETAFGPLDELTKEQILTILWRYAGQPEPESEAPEDQGVSEYALRPMAWALDPDRPLIDQDGEGRLLPQAPMTRAAVAEVLMRYLESI